MPKEIDKDISNYNSFKVFEDIYSDEGSNQTFANNYDEIQPPTSDRTRTPFNFILTFILAVLVSFLAYPLTSYVLKTPHPFVVANDENLRPYLDTSDVALMRGIVHKDDVSVGDWVVFVIDDGSEERELSIRKVVSIIEGDIIVTDGMSSSQSSINSSQVVGVLLGKNKPFKIPILGKFISSKGEV